MVNENGIKVPIRVLIWAVGLVFIAAGVYATMNFTTKKVNKIEPIVYQNKEEVALLKQGQEFMKEGIEEIKVGIKEIKEKL